MIKSFQAQIGNMRKPRTFVTYPRKSDKDPVIVQSDRCIGRFDPVTGEGVINFTGNRFLHLNVALGAKPFTFPAEFRALAIEAGAVSPSGQVALIGAGN